MSILLDALKRSEQQRRLGEVPDIHSPPAAEAGTRGDRNSSLRWILLGVVVVILAWVAWQRIGPDEPPAADGAGAEQVSVTAAGGTASSDAGGSAAAPATGQDAEKPRAVARSPVEMLPRSAQPSRTTAKDPVAPPEQGTVGNSRVNESFTQFEAPAQTDAGQSAPAKARTAVPPAREPTGQAGAARAEPGIEVETTTPAGATPSTAKATEPISFWELPQSVRDSLPELRITVLVYADRSENRFLLMAGRRLFEKDEFQPGIVLDEIRRDGAVFLYRNYRFLVKG